MRVIQQHLKEILGSALSKCLKYPVSDDFYDKLSVFVSNPKFGDYQWNDAMSILKHIEGASPVKCPRELAEMVKNNISHASISSVTVSPKGFLSLTLSMGFLEEEIRNLLREGVTVPQVPSGFRVAIDFSSPNVAKEMHVGHLRSTIIGESIARVLEIHGYETFRINHLGDWGTNFGVLIEYMYEKQPDFTKNLPTISDLTNFYKEAMALMKSDEDFKRRSHNRVLLLQAGDKESLHAWGILRKISIEDFNRIYRQLDVKLEIFGESFYNDLIPKVAEELEEKKIAVRSEGALCVFTGVGKTPLIIVKANKGYGYDSTDIAALKYRIFDLKCKWIIVVTDIGQSDHFSKLFDAAKMAGWVYQDGYEVRLDHVGFGMIQNELGTKFRTRSGETVRLTALLDEAVVRATKELEARAKQEGNDSEVKTDIEKKAKVLGYSAIKYFDLKHATKSNYNFSFDKVLDTRGNTGVYLLYAYARICQVFGKAKKDAEELDPRLLDISHPAEVALVKEILKLPAVLQQVVSSFCIYKLTEYLYDVSCRFSIFYKQCKIVGDKNEDSRLLICHATKIVMKTVFDLIGISPIDQF